MIKKILCFALAALMLCAFPVAVNAADEGTVVYENDFSDPATISDFRQFRATWEIADGKLWITGPADDITDPDTFAHIVLNKDVKWKNYIVEADIECVQTSTGILCHVNNELVDASTANSFAGYLCFLSNDATKGAMGRSNPTDHTAYGGNFGSSVFSSGTTPGSSVHMKVEVIDDMLTLTIYDLETSTELYTYTEFTNEWDHGTVGFRARLNYTAKGLTSINVVSFDNLKVTLLSEATDTEGDDTSAVVTDAPATEPVTEAPATEPVTDAPATEPATTEAPATDAPATAAPATDAPATDAPATEAPATQAPSTNTPSTDDEGGNIGLIIGIIAAVVVLAVVVVIIVKKKKN